MKDWLEFAAKIAWPSVALVGILILGPGGVLKKILDGLVGDVLKITSAVTNFKKHADELSDKIEGLERTTKVMAGLDLQLEQIIGRLGAIEATTQDLAITEGSRNLDKTVNPEGAPAEEPQVLGSAEEMMKDIRERWNGLVDRLRERLGGDQFDARKIGEMAWKLTDGRRNNPISREDAELIGQVHSQMKRFVRLQSTKEEWLTHDVYSALVRGIERAVQAI